MNILERMGVAISANINALLDKVEDPVATLEKLVHDMEVDFAEAKRQVIRAISDEKRLTMKFEKACQQATDWERKAELAVNKGDDKLAKEALLRAKEQNQLSEVFSAELTSQREGTTALKSSLKALEAKIDEASRKKNILAAKHQRAKASKNLNETMSGIGKSRSGLFGSRQSSMQAFSRVEERIEDLEAQAAAAKEIDSDDTDAAFAQLERDDSVNDELAALKARMKAKQSAKNGD